MLSLMRAVSRIVAVVVFEAEESSDIQKLYIMKSYQPSANK